MKKSFVLGNVFLVVGAILLASGIIAGTLSNTVIGDVAFNSYHFIGIGFGIAMMFIGMLVLVLEWVIRFTNDKVHFGCKTCKEEKVEPAKTEEAPVAAKEEAPAKKATKKPAAKK